MFIIKTLKKKHVFNKRKVSLVSPTWDNHCWHPRTVLLILWSTCRFVKTYIPEPHLQRSGVAESGVESESYHPSQHPGSADAPSSGAHTVRISVLNVHHPHMTVWYSPVSQKPLSPGTFLQHHMERLWGMTCYWSGHPWVPGVLNMETTDPKGVHREIDSTCNPVYLFFLFAFKIFFWVGCHGVCQLPEESVTQKLLKTSYALPSEWHLVVSLYQLPAVNDTALSITIYKSLHEYMCT